VKQIALPVIVSLGILSQICAQSIIEAPKLDSGSITIDGVISAGEWDYASSFENIGYLENGTSSDYAGQYKVAWDSNALYVLYSITDDQFSVDSSNGGNSFGNDSYNDDSIELYIDVNNSGDIELNADNKIYQYRFNLEETVAGTQELEWYPEGNQPPGATWDYEISDNLYILETSVSWGDLGISNPTLGTTIGFNVAFNDDDDGGDRDAQYFWVSSTTGNATYNDATTWGDLTLVDAAAIPEPGTYALFLGLFGVAFFIVRRKQTSK